LLLRRDQDRFVDIMTRGFMKKFEGADDPQRLRLEDSLTRRLAILNAIGLRPVAAGPAGTWGNALATVTVRPADNDALQVTLTAKLAYEERTGTLNCDLTGTFKKDGSGWFAGEFASQDAALAWARLRSRCRVRQARDRRRSPPHQSSGRLHT
jgi:hypothetical protein